jgi:Flp pilus assembly secretin CpaC
MQRFSSLLIRSCVAAAVLAGVSACGSLRGDEHAGGAGVGGQSLSVVPVAAESPEDVAITQNVRMQLSRDLPLAEIDVRTAQGKVELRGTVEDTESARKAVKVALAIDGVRGVVNQLDVSADAGGRGTSLAATTF